MFRGFFFFLRYGWKYDRFYVIWRLLFQVVNSLMPLAAALMPKMIIDELMGQARIQILLIDVAVFAGYALIAGALSSYFSLDGFTRRCRVDAEFHSMLHERLALSDFEHLESPAFRDMQEKAEKFLTCDWHGFGYLLDCALNILGQGITLAGLMAILSTLNIWFIALFVLLAGISTWVEGRAKKKAMALSASVVADQRRWMYYSRIFQNEKFGKEIRLNGIGEFLLRRERTFFTRSLNTIKRQNDAYIQSGVIRAALTFCQQAAAYGYVIIQVLRGNMGIGDFSMCIGAVSSFALALRKMMDSVVEIRAYDLYYDALDEYLNMPCLLRQGKILPQTGMQHTIIFKNVSFRYAGARKWALRGVNLTIHGGEKISIVGENGAGKTTLVKLLCRMYDPTEGEILLDGVDIRQLDYDQYMALFSSVFQDYQLFEMSFKENILLNQPWQKEKFHRVLNQVNLIEKVRALPLGADTPVGREFDDRGFLPSGGEAQKIALARALYKDAPIVILDEPSAALDPRAEYELYQGFDRLVQGKTAVYISHRLSSARFCDRIAVLKDGKIVEYGDHETLLQLRGAYATLYHMQAGYYTDAGFMTKNKRAEERRKERHVRSI